MRPDPADTADPERGYSLIEIVVVVALLALIAGGVGEALSRAQGQSRPAAVAFAELVTQARALAESGSPQLPANSGASIAVDFTGQAYVVTLYAGRPIAGDAAPQQALRVPPLRTSTPIALTVNGATVEPPFALFFSTSGHVSAQAGFRIGVSSALTVEPACPLETGIVLSFGSGTGRRAHTISCELARLDLDGDPAPARALRRSAAP